MRVALEPIALRDGLRFLNLRLRVIGKPAILKFAEGRHDALVPLMNWYRITRRADWAL